MLPWRIIRIAFRRNEPSSPTYHLLEMESPLSAKELGYFSHAWMWTLIPKIPWLYVISGVAAFMWASQLIEDAFLLYCMGCEAMQSKTSKQTLVSGGVAAVSAVLHSISDVARFFFVLAITHSSNPWLGRLVLLNVILFLPARIVTLSGGILTALRMRKHEKLELTDADRHREPSLSTTPKSPMTLVIIPCYREPLSMVMASIDSVATSAYNRDRIHIFLSFDGPQNNAVFKQISRIAKAKTAPSRESLCAEGVIGDVNLTLCVFEHGGKTQCQGQTVDCIKRYHGNYMETASDTCVLFLDSDTTIQPSALRLLGAQLHPLSGAPGSLIALTTIQAITGPSSSFSAATWHRGCMETSRDHGQGYRVILCAR
ncbi:hypothetical protein QBC33DRAFT_317262 [Phialemonium atrogriseum]|uniref:Uncharacterized protein n=1 Tax=Phialemonium atrogriseum TaxID=1093897 RepID=A0AAJ0FC80_9PEZI|nr:uncharacterized protein QBC33DRAFT_317262 [Phialemonium atrogriseum]KAK1761862.1 hypothetical protein QBC33DRAFT_317262 [Phialemonium atrogriseum]